MADRTNRVRVVATVCESSFGFDMPAGEKGTVIEERGAVLRGFSVVLIAVYDAASVVGNGDGAV